MFRIWERTETSPKNEFRVIIIKINLTTNYQLLLNCNKVHRAILTLSSLQLPMSLWSPCPALVWSRSLSSRVSQNKQSMIVAGGDVVKVTDCLCCCCCPRGNHCGLWVLTSMRQSMFDKCMTMARQQAYLPFSVGLLSYFWTWELKIMLCSGWVAAVNILCPKKMVASKAPPANRHGANQTTEVTHLQPSVWLSKGEIYCNPKRALLYTIIYNELCIFINRNSLRYRSEYSCLSTYNANL
jgi:hypothetical protein